MNVNFVNIKNDFDLIEIFVLRLYKMAANQTECFGTYHIFWRLRNEIYVCTEKHILVKKNLYTSAKYWFSPKVCGVETHWLTGKENVPHAAVCKEGHADIILRQEKFHLYSCATKRCNYIKSLLLPSLQTKFSLFIECIVPYISSSSCRAGSTDIPDPLSPFLPIVHRPLAGLQDNIPYPHIAAECMFVLGVLLLHGHVWGSIRVHLLWVRPCFSSSVLHVWFV